MSKFPSKIYNVIQNDKLIKKKYLLDLRTGGEGVSLNLFWWVTGVLITLLVLIILLIVAFVLHWHWRKKRLEGVTNSMLPNAGSETWR